MPRAIWSGSISFGLVNIPVKLYSAISEKSVRFHQIDQRNGARVRQQRVNAVTGEEVPYGEIVKGYELSKDHYVMVSEDELAAFAPDATHTIDLECFVDLDEIDPVFFDGAYHVAPSMAAKPYALLVRAMEESNKVAIARFVMRSKEYVAALRPRDGTLVLSMMVYSDEINPASDIGEFDDVAAVEIERRELAMAESLIESLSESFDPETFHDTYRDKVLELIERKSAGESIDVNITAAPSADKVIDLMAALEASVKAAKSARGRHPTRMAAEADEEAPPKRTGSAGSAGSAVKKSTKKAAPPKTAAKGSSDRSSNKVAAKKISAASSAKKSASSKVAAKKSASKSAPARRKTA